MQRDTLCLHTARHGEDLPSTKDPQEQCRCSVHMQLHIHPTAELTAPMLPGIPCLASTTCRSQGLSQGSRNLPRLPVLSAPSLFPPAIPELRLLGNNLHIDSNQAWPTAWYTSTTRMGDTSRSWIQSTYSNSSHPPYYELTTLQTLTISKARPIKSSP